MSQSVKSHIIERECQGCGKKREYEMVGLHESEELLVEASQWLTIIRETTQISQDGSFVKMIVHACNPGCAQKAATRLFQLPTKDDEPVDNIDLSQLRIN